MKLTVELREYPQQYLCVEARGASERQWRELLHQVGIACACRARVIGYEQSVAGKALVRLAGELVRLGGMQSEGPEQPDEEACGGTAHSPPRSPGQIECPQSPRREGPDRD